MAGLCHSAMEAVLGQPLRWAVPKRVPPILQFTLPSLLTVQTPRSQVHLHICAFNNKNMKKKKKHRTFVKKIEILIAIFFFVSAFY